MMHIDAQYLESTGREEIAMDSPQKLTPVVKYGGGFIALLVAAGLIASVLDASSPATVAATPVAPAAPAVTEPPPAPAVAPRAHNYVMEDGGEYGYEHPASQDQINAGTTTNPLVMIRYLGQRKDGSYAAAMRDGAAQTTVSCKEPCDYMRVSLTYDGQPVGTPSVLPAGDNLATAIMLDAMAGYLKPYRATARDTESE